MVAYSFQPQFEDPILGLRKSQTIREVGRRRHARPGEELQIYRGMRTKQCRLIGRAVCLSVNRVSLDFAKETFLVKEMDGALIATYRPQGTRTLNAFAKADGFLGYADMLAFWDKHHPEVDLFDGVMITWKEFRRGPDYA